MAQGLIECKGQKGIGEGNEILYSLLHNCAYIYIYILN